MHLFGIDLETFSPEDIKKSGLYRYALNPEFDILLFGYSLNGAEPVVLDCTRTNDRLEMLEMAPLLYDAAYRKGAWNAAFEWYCLSVYLNRYGKYKGLLPIDQWRDTQLLAQYLGYPSSLDKAGAAIGIPEDKKKMGVGKSLIRLFCSPRKPTKRDGRTRVMAADEPEKWELFKTYNKGDVVAEQTIAQTLSKWSVPDKVQEQWELDMMHNAMGVNVDLDLVYGAQSIAEQNTELLLKEAAEITGLDNPNSRDQLQKWLTEELPDEEIPDLRKETVSGLLDGVSEDHVKRVLEIRQETGKAAHKKYAAIQKMVCPDGRLRGLMKFYGANRTGRWASVGVQLQNLARTHLNDVDAARHIVERGDLNALRFTYGAVSDTLGQLVRTALIPSPGNVFVDCDFSAIEARVLAWLAGEEWVLDVFRTHGKIYEATASQMFGVPMELIKKGNPEYELRQRGKVAQLACIAKGCIVPYRNPFKVYAGDETAYDEKPIEQILPGDFVWDGVDWVQCDGAAYMGERQVVEYQGLWATYDHMVYTREYWPDVVPLWYAIAKGLKLETTWPVQPYPEDVHIREEHVAVYDILNAGPNHRYAVQGVLVHNCGYGGGAHAMETMDINHAIDPAQYPGLVKKWRSANPNIVKYWYDTENAALETMRTGMPHTAGYCTFALEVDDATNQWFLTCLLPSGRQLFYVRPTLAENRFGRQSIRYWGIDGKSHKWAEIDTYSGRIVENITQAVARDCLAEKLPLLEAAGYPVVFSIHDEIVADVPKSYADLKTVQQIMSAPMPWAPGLPLNAEGWVGDYFKKD